MGEFSRLGPVDPQVVYTRSSDNWLISVSALSMKRAYETLKLELRTTAREEVAYPEQVLAEKLDPVLMEDWDAECTVVATYLQEVLTSAKYSQGTINTIVRNLVFTTFPHDYVIHRDRAREYKIKCETDDSERLQYLELMEEWLIEHMFESDFRHYIRFVTPAMEADHASKNTIGGLIDSSPRSEIPSGRVGEGEESAIGRQDGARAEPTTAGA